LGFEKKKADCLRSFTLMKKIQTFLILLAVTLVAGCATFSEGFSQEEHETCIWGTAVTGAAFGAIGGVGGAAAGTFVGTLGGLLLCRPVGTPPPVAAVDESGYYWPDDQDRDGVKDKDDLCPFTPDGVAVDSNGCALDNDGDGVPNYLDKCPETPLGTVVDTDGCARTLVTLQDVHFAFDSAQLTSEAKSILNAAIPLINANPSNNISVEGHTDSTGSDAYNSQLSLRRARSVAEYLAAHGVSSSRLKPVGKGESHPIASNDTREGRALNRRVSVIAK
jgi:OmpA-OmpF porin, OOP family